MTTMRNENGRTVPNNDVKDTSDVNIAILSK